MDMNVTTQEMKRCELVTVTGRVDASNAPDLEKTLLDMVARGKKNIVVNMAGVEYISSAGLKALLAALIRSRRSAPAGDVVISQIRPELKEVFELVGLTHLFKFYDDNVQAVGSF